MTFRVVCEYLLLIFGAAQIKTRKREDENQSIFATFGRFHIVHMQRSFFFFSLIRPSGIIRAAAVSKPSIPIRWENEARRDDREALMDVLYTQFLLLLHHHLISLWDFYVYCATE